MTPARTLVLASGNRHKLDELRRALAGWEIELLDRDDPPPEDGETFEDNARLKARWGRRHVREDAWAVGEDSGIEASALGGAPGVRTARWAAGEPVARMLEALAGETDRRARYVCAIVALASDGREVVAAGTLDGFIAEAAAGRQGFGFDPCSSPTARAARSPSSETTGSGRTRTGRGPPRRSRRSSSASAPPRGR